MISRIAASDVENALRRQAAVGLIGPRQVGKTNARPGDRAHARCALPRPRRPRRPQPARPSPRCSSTTWRTGSSSSTRSTGCPSCSRRCGASSTGAGAGGRAGAGSSSWGRRRSTCCASRARRWRDASRTSTWRRSRRSKWTTPARRARGCGCGAAFPTASWPRATRTAWRLRRDFIRTYLERDVAMFGPRVPAATLDRLWTMLAHPPKARR